LFFRALFGRSLVGVTCDGRQTCKGESKGKKNRMSSQTSIPPPLPSDVVANLDYTQHYKLSTFAK